MMTENFAGSRTASFAEKRQIEQLLIDIVEKISGGGKLDVNLVDQIFRGRTGFSLTEVSAHETVPEGTRGPDISSTIAAMLGYVKSILSPDSPLVVNCEDGSLSLRYEESALTCNAECIISLPQIMNEIRMSGRTTKLDLSRRCFDSSRQLLEVCKAAGLLKSLILRDVHILTDGKESPQGCSLLEIIKWYCPALEEVDVTGCSQVTLDKIFQSERSSRRSPSTVTIVDLFETYPNAKPLLSPQPSSNDVSDVSSRIRALVEDGVPVNISYDGWSFLHTASAFGDADLVFWLLENDAHSKLTAVSSYRPSALEVAVCSHNAPIVKHLLDKTDDLDPSMVRHLFQCLFSKGHNDLHIDHTSKCIPLEVAKLLIERSSLDLKTSLLNEVAKVLHRTPLRELYRKTCWTDDSLADLFKGFVISGCHADLPTKDLGGKTVLMCAVESPVLVQTLLDLGANVHAVDHERNTALFYAVCKAEVETTEELLQACQILLSYGSDVNASNKCAESPLLYATSPERLPDDSLLIERMLTAGSSVKIWELLSKSGADFAAKNKDGKSVMHLLLDCTKGIMRKLEEVDSEDKILKLSEIAINRCNEQIEDLLKRNKQLVMLRDNVGNTPLHVLVDNPSCNPHIVRIAKSLIVNGSKVNSRNDRDKTPLHLVGSWDLAKFLLENGAIPNALDDLGCTPLICRLMRASPTGALEFEAVSKWSDGVNFGMDPWIEDREGQNAFTILMEKSQFGELRHFIDVTFNCNKEHVLKTDGKHNTLVHTLCGFNDSRVRPLVDYLLQKGVDVNAKNNNGDTALHILCREINRLHGPKRNNATYWKLIPRLRAYGALCNLKNKAGSTVLDIAWFDKTGLLKAVRRIPSREESHSLLPWEPASQKHRDKLYQVARRQHCHKITDFWYHEEPIGSGAFGYVFAGINVDDGRDVCLKRTQNYKLRTRHNDREVRSLLQLSNCPHVVKYFLFTRETDFTWIVLELMEGNLDDLMGQGIDKEVIPKLCSDLLLGIKYLHENEILHRDLKPSNVLYKHEHQPRLKIGDFGLSKNLGSRHLQGSSVLHSHAGSKSWMAKELLVSSGSSQHSFATDVFACGLIMHYIMANRQHPYEGGISDDRNSIAYYNALEENIKNDSKTLHGDLSEEATDLLEQLLAEREERPMASKAVKHPYFWSNDKKTRFIRATGNQCEIATNYPSPVRNYIMKALDPTFHVTPWDNFFPSVYRVMTTGPRGRRNYVTTSAVELVRFIRNSYAHVSEFPNPAFQHLLLKDYTFFKELPNLFMVIYRAVKLGKWETMRSEIATVVESN